MAKTKQHKETVRRLRAGGLRKRVARSVADALDGGTAGRAPKEVTRVVDNLRSLAGDLEDRALGGRSAKRRAAARTAARTRARNAKARSDAAKRSAAKRGRPATRAGRAR
jgi:hypothetical protein